MFDSQTFTPRYETLSSDIVVGEDEIKSVFESIDSLDAVSQFSYSLVGSECFVTVDAEVFSDVQERLPESVQIETANVTEAGVSFRCSTARWLQDESYVIGDAETTALLVAYLQELTIVDEACVVERDEMAVADITFTKPVSDTYYLEEIRPEFQTTVLDIETVEDGMTRLQITPLDTLSHENRDYLTWSIIRNHLSFVLEGSQYESDTIGDGVIESVMLFEVSDSIVESLPTQEVCGVETTPIDFEQNSGNDLTAKEEFTEDRSDSFVSFFGGYAFVPDDEQTAYVFKIEDLKPRHYHLPTVRPVKIDGIEKQHTFGIPPLEPLDSWDLETSSVLLCLEAFSR